MTPSSLFRRSGAAQRGTTAVEFGLCSVVFFVFVFFLLELARVMYLWNTMTDTTRRIARVASYSDPADAAAIRLAAPFRPDGTLPLGNGIGAANVALSYLNNAMAPVAPLPCPAQNLINCAANPDGASCVRFVQVRLCANGAGACDPLVYTPLFLPHALVPWIFNFPSFATLTPAGTLGFRPGAADACST